jgi:hypothetical protein
VGIPLAVRRGEGIMGEYEEKQKKVSEAYDGYRKEFYKEGLE